MPDKLEDSCRIGNQEVVPRIFFKNEAQTLLLGLLIWRTAAWALTFTFNRLFNLRLVEEHQVLDLKLQQVVRLDGNLWTCGCAILVRLPKNGANGFFTFFKKLLAQVVV